MKYIERKKFWHEIPHHKKTDDIGNETNIDDILISLIILPISPSSEYISQSLYAVGM